MFANVLLGVNQGLTWPTTVIMKIDLVGPARRGLAMGFNEAAGYVAVAATAMATGALAAHAGLRPEPFLLGAAYAALTTGQIARRTSLTDKALSSASWAGMVNNANDALAWGVFPLLFKAHGLSVTQIGVLAAVYPAVWGAGQMLTGWWSDHIGRKHLITAGMLLQAVAIGLVASGTTFWVWVAAQVLLGAGTALVYPTLLAVIGDVAHPAWRARAVGALLAGAVADLFGVEAAIWTVAVLTAVAGLVVALRMYETHPRPAH